MTALHDPHKAGMGYAAVDGPTPEPKRACVFCRSTNAPITMSATMFVCSGCVGELIQKDIARFDARLRSAAA